MCLLGCAEGSGVLGGVAWGGDCSGVGWGASFGMGGGSGSVGRGGIPPESFVCMFAGPLSRLTQSSEQACSCTPPLPAFNTQKC